MVMGRVRAAALILAVVASVGPLRAPEARAQQELKSFEPGALVIPMDTDYQDFGMLKAFGLVYALLRADVPVRWVINPDKELGGTDFVASATDIETGESITDHGYRGGPFVVTAADAAAALPVITLWQSQHTTAVHEATTAFDGYVMRHLVAAPTIGVFSDGNEDIAFDYLNAAAIPDSLGQPWPDGKDGDKIYPGYPDVLNVEEVAGPTDTNHADGALFDDAGNPVYCQLMTMHWGVKDVVDEVVAEMRSFLEHPTHLFAQCQAVNAIENNVHGRFLTPNGFEIDDEPKEVAFLNQYLPFAQLDGPYETVGGSEPAYSLPEGDEYFDKDIVMITAADSPVGVQDVWMTGYFEAQCFIGGYVGGELGLPEPCEATGGKVSYLGGHKYKTDLPISKNPDTQGTRLFLNSLFEADCASAEGQPYVTLTKSGPATTTEPEVTWTLFVTNYGPAVVLNAVVSDPLPEGATFVSADGGSYDPDTHTVTWSLGNLAAGSDVMLTLTVSLDAPGVYDNAASLAYSVGINSLTLESNTAQTTYDLDSDGDGCPDALEANLGTSPDLADTDEDGVDDCEDTCPLDPNPLQDLSVDPDHCGACDTACSAPDAQMACDNGDCVLAGCDPGFSNCDDDPSNGCETPGACPTPEPDIEPAPDVEPQPEPAPVVEPAAETAPDAAIADAGSGDAQVPPTDAGPEPELDAQQPLEGGASDAEPDEAETVEDAGAEPDPEPGPDAAPDAASDADFPAPGDTAADAGPQPEADAGLDTSGSGADSAAPIDVPAGGGGGSETESEGCNCRVGERPDPTAPLVFGVLALLWIRRRRRHA